MSAQAPRPSHPWRSLVRLLSQSPRLFALAVLTAAVQAALLLPVAALIRHLIDTDVPQGDDGAIVVGGALILALYLASNALRLVSIVLVGRTAKDGVTRLRRDLFERLYSLPPAWHDKQEAGRLHSVVVHDSERVDLMLNELALNSAPSIVVGLALACVGLVLEPLLFAALLVIVPAVLLAGTRFGGRFRARVRDWNEDFDTFSAGTQRTLRGMRMATAMGVEQVERSDRANEAESLSRAGKKLLRAAGLHGFVQSTLTGVAGVVTLVIGGIAVARGSMTLGELIAFYAIVALLIRQVSAIVPGVPTVLGGFESLQRLETLLAADEPQPYTGRRAHALRGAVGLEDVWFGYDGEPVLRGVNLSLDPGEVLALRGPSGVGKTTLLVLVLGLRRPDSGRVLVDGVPLDEIDLPALRRQLGVVLQEPVLVAGTVRENIAFGRPEVTDADVRTAATLAGAMGFIDDLADGYGTRIGDEGSLISGGQRQRIAIARALVHEPRLLVLDEPTTHLDRALVAQVMDNLVESRRETSILLVTHDPLLCERADRVVELEGGRIAGDDAAYAGARR
jgi:ATP-binding cassette subfamily B protein